MLRKNPAILIEITVQIAHFPASSTYIEKIQPHKDSKDLHEIKE